MSIPEYKMIARGRTADVLAWQDGQVLKLFFDGVPVDAIEREVKVARLVSTMDLPTPKLLGEHTLIERKGLIFERVDGQSTLTHLGNRPWRVIRLARQFAELHADIHKHSGVGLSSLKNGLIDTLHRMQGLTPELIPDLYELLDTLPDSDRLIHLDYHPDQVILTDSGAVVIDWMNAMAGDPAMDVAYTFLLLNVGSVPDASWFKQALINLIRGVFYRAYLRWYLKCNPLVRRADIDAWMPLAIVGRIINNLPGEKEKLQAMLNTSFEHG